MEKDIKGFFNMCNRYGLIIIQKDINKYDICKPMKNSKHKHWFFRIELIDNYGIITFDEIHNHKIYTIEEKFYTIEELGKILDMYYIRGHEILNRYIMFTRMNKPF